MIDTSRDPRVYTARRTARWPSSAIGESIDHIVAKDIGAYRHRPGPQRPIARVSGSATIIVGYGKD